MTNDLKRSVVVRLIVIVTVDVTDEEFLEFLAAAGKSTSVAEVVSSEIASNLESIRYLEAVAVSRL